MGKNNEYEEILLFSSLNDYQINEICAMLTENNIPFIRKDDGVGSYMNLYMRHSYQEKSVFVSKKDYDRALELISVITTNAVDEEEEIFEEEQQDENDKTSNALTIVSKIAICTVLILPILLIILGIILAILQKIK